MCVFSLTCGSLRAAADVGVLSVLAGASILARLAQTLVDVGLTQPASESRVTLATEGGQAIDAGAVVAGVRVTLIDVILTVSPGVSWGENVRYGHILEIGGSLYFRLKCFCSSLYTFSALAGVLVRPVCALGAIFARRAGTLVNVYLAQRPSEAWKNNKRLLLCACVHEEQVQVCVCVCVQT